MNELKVFENPEFGSVRTVSLDDVPYFSGKDIAEILGYSNPQKAIRDHVDEDDKTLNESFTVNGTKGVLINESGLYSLILSSKLESSKKFKKWVTSEVIPSIRKNGGYIAGQETMTDDDLMAQALVVAQKKIESRNKVIEYQNRKITSMEPKAVFADAVATSHTSILVGELAKLICQNGYETGQNRLFAWMKDNGYLIKRKGTDHGMPTQKSIEMGLFEIKETAISRSDGVRINKTVKVTGKGQIYFVNKFAKKEVI